MKVGENQERRGVLKVTGTQECSRTFPKKPSGVMAPHELPNGSALCASRRGYEGENGKTESNNSSNSSLSTSVRPPLPREVEKAKNVKEKERWIRQSRRIYMQTRYTNKLYSTASTSLSLFFARVLSRRDWTCWIQKTCMLLCLLRVFWSLNFYTGADIVWCGCELKFPKSIWHPEEPFSN